MLVTEPDNTITTKWHKSEGYTTIYDDNIHEHLAKFCTINGEFCRDLAAYFLQKTEDIREWFAVQTEKLFFTTSVMYFYDSSNWQENRSVGLVDFVYVFPAEGELDINYLDGLEEVILTWKKLV